MPDDEQKCRRGFQKIGPVSFLIVLNHDGTVLKCDLSAMPDWNTMEGEDAKLAAAYMQRFSEYILLCFFPRIERTQREVQNGTAYLVGQDWGSLGVNRGQATSFPRPYHGKRILRPLKLVACP